MNNYPPQYNGNNTSDSKDEQKRNEELGNNAVNAFGAVIKKLSV